MVDHANPKKAHHRIFHTGESLPPPAEDFPFLSCRHCSCSIVLTSYSLETQVMLILILINIQDSQKAVSSFEKGWNWQNHSSSTPLPPVKCLILSTPLGKIYLLPPLTTIWKTLHQCKKCFVNSKRLYS